MLIHILKTRAGTGFQEEIEDERGEEKIVMMRDKPLVRSHNG